MCNRWNNSGKESEQSVCTVGSAREKIAERFQERKEKCALTFLFCRAFVEQQWGFVVAFGSSQNGDITFTHSFGNVQKSSQVTGPFLFFFGVLTFYFQSWFLASSSCVEWRRSNRVAIGAGNRFCKRDVLLTFCVQLLLDYHNRAENVLGALEDLREDVDAAGTLLIFENEKLRFHMFQHRYEKRHLLLVF